MNILRKNPEKMDEFKKLKRVKYDEDGHEIPNPVPKFKIIGSRPDTLEEQIDRCIRKKAGRMVVPVVDSPEESDDFDFDDPDDMTTAYTVTEEFDSVPPVLPVNPPSDHPNGPEIDDKGKGDDPPSPGEESSE